MSKIQEIAAAIESGKTKEVGPLVQEALDEGVAPLEILNVGMIDTMKAVGEKFQRDEVFVVEMLVAARAMKKGVDVLRPHLVGDDAAFLGKVIIGTVEGDLHDIGKNLVAMMIESAGFEVNDLGVDVKASTFVETLEADEEISIVCCSALLTTTLPALKATVEALNASSARSRVKIIIGGAPVRQELVEEFGADAYAPDAASAAEVAKGLAN